MRTGKRLLCLLLLWPFVVSGAESIDRDHILTPSELAAFDRENAMWRLVRVEDDVDANLRLLRSRGFAPSEVEWLQPRLAAMWEIGLERNYGWLSKEAIERIKGVDRLFTVRLRAVRLYEEAGIRTGPHAPEKMAALSRDWRRAIQRELDYRENAEFRLMNSRSAQQVAEWAKGLGLRTDELRTLCEWQRDFEGEYGAEANFADRFRQDQLREEKLDCWAKIRRLLGDERFAVYLARANADFDQLKKEVAEFEGVSSTVALDLWWLRENYKIDRVRVRNQKDALALGTEVSAKVSALLGEERFALYSQNEAGRWLRY